MMADDSFRLALVLPTWQQPLSYADRILLIGSCFTENMYHKLSAYKFQVQQNPHGILFNPLSIAHAIDDYTRDIAYDLPDLVYINEAWHSWHHHSIFSSPDPMTVYEKTNTSIAEARNFLSSATCCVITLGSAFVYELISEGNAQDNEKKSYMPVANCHRAPASWFRRRLMSYAEVDNTLSYIIDSLQKFNQQLQIILTVSPVRHLREGFIDNNRSKATLLLATHDVVARYSHVHYFPSYELVLDDLRDYRFYAEDMAHPNYTATNYVWRKFVDTCIDTPTRRLMNEVEKVVHAYKHTPFNPYSAAHQRFLADSLQKTQYLQTQLPFLDWQSELAHFQK